MTRKQLDILRFIAGYQEAHGGVSPAMRECGRALGISAQGVLRSLNALEEEGFCFRLRERNRAIQILRVPSIPHAPDGAPLYAVPL